MSFLELDAVRALRQELGVPENMTVPDALRHMSELMGLPVKNDAGALLSLPAQVEQQVHFFSKISEKNSKSLLPRFLIWTKKTGQIPA